MSVLGLEDYQPARSAALVLRTAQGLSPVWSRGGFWPWLRESFTGAWQQNVVVDQAAVLAHSTVFACLTLIAGDLSKMTLRLLRQDAGTDIWTPPTSPTVWSPVLRKPNRYQNIIQFVQQWVLSKLSYGNTYVLKERDNRGGAGNGIVRALYILDPNRVRPLVAPDGSIFYQLDQDTISSLPTSVTVPASEIIHDRINCLFHPLVGLSPIYACGLSATVGLRIQNAEASLFANGGRPGGILTAPGAISDDTAKRLKDYWDNNFTGANAGKVAVLGDGLKFDPNPVMSSVDAQVIDQLKWNAEQVCSTFHVPPYMVGVGAPPNFANVQALAVQYFTQCLQVHAVEVEACLDEGIELPPNYATAFNEDDLLRMDSATMMETIVKGLQGVLKPNEGRAKLNLPPVPGGDTPYMQQQMFSLAALAERDAAQPFAKPAPAPPALPAEPTEEAVAATVGELAQS